MTLENVIKNKALELGFDLAGITSADPVDHLHSDSLQKWLEDGCAGTMHYMHNNFEKRTNPSALLENAKSIITVALNYKIDKGTSTKIDRSMASVCDYALYPDYHPFIKQRLFILANWLSEQIDEKFKIKACVDSVPILERAIAQRAGLGFIGKNTMLINPQLGPRLLIGLLITTLELKPDAPIKQNCGDCTLCLESCPTKALEKEYKLNASRCINYLTIEHKGDIPEDLAKDAGTSLYGCDRCVDVCPYAQKSPAAKNQDFEADMSRAQISPEECLDWHQEDFASSFSDSAVLRAGLENIKRNARMSIKNIRASE